MQNIILDIVLFVFILYISFVLYCYWFCFVVCFGTNPRPWLSFSHSHGFNVTAARHPTAANCKLKSRAALWGVHPIRDVIQEMGCHFAHNPRTELGDDSNVKEETIRFQMAQTKNAGKREIGLDCIVRKESGKPKI
jgi:hypothetical protein